MIISTKDHNNSTTVAAASTNMLKAHVVAAAGLGNDGCSILGKVRHGLQPHNTNIS
jgi:hypothetical protein